MEPALEDDVQSEAALADRLARLAERRQASTRRHRSRSPGDSWPDEGSRERFAAVQALRELLEGRGAALEGAMPPGDAQDGLPLRLPACQRVDSSCQPALPPELAPPPYSARDTYREPASSASSPGPSMPSTARQLITLSSGIGREAAAADRQQRSTELHTADAVVREAEATRAALDALLLRQRAEQAQRERQRAERQAELDRIQLVLAREHMAAWRIARAWRRFLTCPGRLREVAAATRVQCAWRGWVTRRRTKAQLEPHRRRCSLLAQLRIAVGACDLRLAEQAAGELAGLGAGAQAGQQVEALRQQAQQAERALREAAAAGGADAYRASLAAAEQYLHLAGARREAAAQFAARVAAAEEAVRVATEGATLQLFKETAAAAAALGVGAAFLDRAEQRVRARNADASAALQAALEAAPFSSGAHAAAMERVQAYGLHADVARAQRALQLRRQRAAGNLQQLAAEGRPGEVEAACKDASELGLEAETAAALNRLEQRQATAAEELRQAANHGTLAQYQAADEEAGVLQASSSLRQACKERVQQRQQEAERQLRVAAARPGDLTSVRRKCQAALQLGLTAAAEAAEAQVQQRREAAAHQLAASTRAACTFASGLAQMGQEQGSEAAAAAFATPRGTPWLSVLAAWVAGCQQLTREAAKRGAAASLLHPPQVCASWPAELQGWLVDAHRAADLELDAAVLTALRTFQSHLEALQAAATVVATPLQQPAAEGSRTSSIGSRGRPAFGSLPLTPQEAASGSSSGDSQANVQPPSHCQPEHGGEHQPGWPAGEAQRLLACFKEWREAQQDLLPLVARPAERGADGGGAGEEGDEEEGEGEKEGEEPEEEAALDLSRQGLTSLEIPQGSSSSALAVLNVSGNRLTSLQGLEALARLAVLDASNNPLQGLPSLQGLACLRDLDLSATGLTGAMLASAGIRKGACSQLTSLRLAGNDQLAELGSWLGPLPSLLHLDVGGCGLASLAGLSENAPLLQVLVAPRNRLPSLDPSLRLPFLRELWLGGNCLASVPAWPWMPSLRRLQLEENQLASLAPMQGFPSLTALDLSANRLSSLAGALASLAPLAATLDVLRLNDNPFWAPAGGQLQRPQPGAVAVGGGRPLDGAAAAAEGGSSYSAAVFQVLPGLRELDCQTVAVADRQQHIRAAFARQKLAQQACPDSGVRSSDVGGGAWDAQTLLWALTGQETAQGVQQAEQQQRAMAMAALAWKAEAGALESQEAAGLAFALASLQLAAAGSAGARPDDEGQHAALAGHVGSSRHGWRERLRLAQQQYLLLAAAEPSAAQDLLLLNSAYYQQLLSRLGAAATRLQAAWRGLTTRRHLARLAAEGQARKEAAAAVCIQTAWRGWAVRQRRFAWVQHRLVIWRHEWREAQRRVLEHQQQCAAVRIQAAWRGARVRRLVALARQLLAQQRMEAAGGARRESTLGLELEASLSQLEGLLEGAGSSLFGAPEVLRPELAASAAAAGGALAKAGLAGQLDWAALAGEAAGDAFPWPLHAEEQAASGGSWGQHSQKLLTSKPAGSAASTSLPGSAGGTGRPPCQPASPSHPSGGDGEPGWEFADASTAAAYAQLRQRQAAAARRRELKQQLKDPVRRCSVVLQQQGRGVLPSAAACRSPGRARKPSGRGSGHSSGGGSSSGDWSLPALRSPPACQGLAGSGGGCGARAGSGSSPGAVALPDVHRKDASPGRRGMHGGRPPVQAVQLFEGLP